MIPVITRTLFESEAAMFFQSYLGKFVPKVAAELSDPSPEELARAQKVVETVERDLVQSWLTVRESTRLMFGLGAAVACLATRPGGVDFAGCHYECRAGKAREGS